MKKIITSVIFFLIIFSCKTISAQNLFVRGRLIDAKDSSKISGALVALFSWPDTAKFEKNVSDSIGKFAFMNVAPGKYKLKVFYTGYITFEKEINIEDKPVFLRRVALVEDPRFLKEVKVEGTQTRQEQKGDTTIYNADAFKVNKDASTEDLVKKMPGIT
ncbi:MAG: carboxypeptidase regulatory-like domain-containing protein, partial [Bacteroidia bacterium]|nr:carboxypeptidase regulatory-like domain-containing protein [Bacteroidia bacterium]